jgi:hypothetical protein
MVSSLFSELPEWFFTLFRSMEPPPRGNSGIFAIDPVFHTVHLYNP